MQVWPHLLDGLPLLIGFTRVAVTPPPLREFFRVAVSGTSSFFLAEAAVGFMKLEAAADAAGRRVRGRVAEETEAAAGPLLPNLINMQKLLKFPSSYVRPLVG